MGWPSLADQALVATRDVFGETVTYERGGVSVEIVAPFDARGGIISFSDGTHLETVSPLLAPRLADLPGGVAKQNDTWTIHGITYRVAEVIPDGGGGVDLIGQEQS